MAENDLTKENCMEMLRDAYKQLERYPKKSDFTVEEVAAKSIRSVWDTAGSFGGTGGSKAAETDRCEKAADTVQTGTSGQIKRADR